MSHRERDSPGAAAPGFVCPLCGRSLERDRRYCSSCGGNLVVRRDDDQVYDRIVRMCGNPCTPPSGPDDG